MATIVSLQPVHRLIESATLARIPPEHSAAAILQRGSSVKRIHPVFRAAHCPIAVAREHAC